MSLESFVNLQYCYEYLINQIPVSLLLYSHVPTALAALAFGGYVFIKARNLPSGTLFIACLAFATWCLFDLGSWFAFLGSGRMMFMWSLLDLVALIFFGFAYYFLYSFITGKDVPVWQKTLGIALILPVAVSTLLGMNLLLYDANICEAWENTALGFYTFFVEGVILLGSIVLTIKEYRKASGTHRREIVLAATGVMLCLLFFFSATLAVALLVDYQIGEYAYNYEIYGLFGMPILLIYLGHLIVKYHAFDLRVFSAQALVFALIILIGSEFAFVENLTNRILVSITLVLTILFGIVLIRSVRREIQQRERIELLANELKQSNQHQVTLIHFITHQLKGFVTKSRNAFSMMLDGDYGPVPDSLRPIIEEGFRSDTRGVNTIQEILNAANLKSGKVTYVKAPVDVQGLVTTIVGDLKPNATAKNLELTVSAEPGDYTIMGDVMQLTNAFKNLIDNSIKYTLEGGIAVILSRQEQVVRLAIVDTGIGITPEDMKTLFTEGGHGQESHKVNVESTGFGLYIVKSIIEAHHGRVWAESEGAGKGSTFIVELPVS